MRDSTYEYINFRRISYGHGTCFVPVCPNCGRFVKADEMVKFNMEGEVSPDPNATCTKCGRINMPFEGYGYIDPA